MVYCVWLSLEGNTQTNHKVTGFESVGIAECIYKSALVGEIQIETVIPDSYADIHTGIKMIVVNLHIICIITPTDAFSIFFHFACVIVTSEDSYMRVDTDVVRHSKFPSECERRILYVVSHTFRVVHFETTGAKSKLHPPVSSCTA